MQADKIQPDVFVNAGIDKEIEITLHLPLEKDSENVAIFIGREKISLDFFDVQSLERLRDTAEEGAQHLRTVIWENARREAIEAAAEASGQPVRV